MKTLVTAALFALTSTAAFAENPMVGGAAMYEEKNIVENAVNSKDHTTWSPPCRPRGWPRR